MQPTYTTSVVQPDVTIMSPYMQFGFAAFALALMALLAWVIREIMRSQTRLEEEMIGMVKSKDVLDVVRENTRVQEELKAAIDKLSQHIEREGRR